MPTEEMMKRLIRDIPDFPTQGILFRDITPVLQDAAAFKQAVGWMVERCGEMSPDVIVGIESRGFVLGSPVALELGVGFVPVRKAGKLPAETVRAEYSLEYGTNVVEMHRDAIAPGMQAVIVDDRRATGGTARAAARLVEELGGRVAGFCFFIELTFLEGRRQLEGYRWCSLVSY